jgi:hypothetical protein
LTFDAVPCYPRLSQWLELKPVREAVVPLA